MHLALQSLNLPLDTADEDEIGSKVANVEKDSHFAEGFVFKGAVLTEALRSIDKLLDVRAHEEVDRLEAEKKKQGGAKAAVKVQEEVYKLN